MTVIFGCILVRMIFLEIRSIGIVMVRINPFIILGMVWYFLLLIVVLLLTVGVDKWDEG